MKIELRLYRAFLLMGILVMLGGIIFIFFAERELTVSKHEVTKKTSMFAWILFTYAVISAFVVLIEKYHTQSYSHIQTYKDATLAFSHLSPLLKDEEQIIEAFQELSDHRVLEVSLIYNLTDMFRLEAELEALRKKSGDSEDLAEQIVQKEKELKDFKEHFAKNKRSYFTGKGFVTFQNFKRAKLFKDLYNKVYGNLQLFRKTRAVSRLAQRLQKAANKAVTEKTLHADDKEKKQQTQEAGISYRSKTFLSKTDPVEISQASSKKRKSTSTILANVSRLLLAESKNIDEEKIKRMPVLLGLDLKIKRGIDPEMINFNFQSKRKITYFQQVFYAVVLIFIMPMISYFFNYMYYKYEIHIYIEHSTAVTDKLMKYLHLIMTVVVDQATFLLIDMFFSKRRFIKTTRRFIYTMTFSSFYILLSNIVVPNFALKKAFLDITPLMDFNERRKTLEHLVSSLYFNYYILIFSMVNFKILKPLLASRFGKGAEVQDFQNVIFGISFIINSIFYVAFYGTVTPSVFVYFFITLVAVYLYEITMKYKARFSKEQAARKKTDAENLAEEKAEVVEEARADKIPINTFSLALIILAVGTFLLACLGYYGLTVDVDYFLNMTEPKKHGFFASLFVYTKNAFDKFHDFLVEPLAFIPETSPNIFGMVKNTLFSIAIEAADKFFEDELLMFFTILYALFVAVFIFLNHTERFLNRLQSRIWKIQKVVPSTEFHGKSYREINPAYAILDK
jgi:hypothetical protein